MTTVHVGKLVRRAALVASTALFSTCAPASISAPPPMRPVPDGPALAGRRIGVLDLSRVMPAGDQGAVSGQFSRTRRTA
jgi:hypothetical protein